VLAVALVSQGAVGDTAVASRAPTEEGRHFPEAPSLARRVAAGTLPPLPRRLPQVPMVVEPTDTIGTYGGTWHLAVLRGSASKASAFATQDVVMFTRYLGYENLVRWDAQWTRVVPNVAQSVKVNDIATEFTFSLRKGMRWSDGEPFTADDIMFWYNDVLLNKELVRTPPSWLTADGKLPRVRKLDPFTVVFQFPTPNGLFLANLAHPQGLDPTSFPRHYLEKFHVRYNPKGVERYVAQSGARSWRDLFALKAGLPDIWSDGRFPVRDLPTLNAWIPVQDARENGSEIVVERNPYYWKTDPKGQQLPYIDRQIYHVFDDAQSLARYAYSGGVSMQDRHLAFRPYQKPELSQEYALYTLKPSLSNVMAISLNLSHRDPLKRSLFQRKEFRRGLSHAIDRRRIIATFFHGESAPYQVAPVPESAFYHPRLAQQDLQYDVALANQLLDQTGYVKRDGQGFRTGPDGHPLSLKITVSDFQPTESRQILELIKSDWQAVGIDATIDFKLRQDFYDLRKANLHDCIVWTGEGGSDVLLNPRFYVPMSVESNFGVGWAYWHQDPGGALAQEPPIAVKRQLALYDQLLATADASEQAALMNDILDIAQDQFYVIGIASFPTLKGLVKKNMKNVPAVMPFSWTYPDPAPTNPAQYFFEAP
jgi:peptide/nickel transport system substrate-binding protein